MRSLKLVLMIFAAGMLAAALGGVAYAFHSGGVAECSGCHSMHEPKAGGSFLLVGTDQSSACLTCHQNANDTVASSYHISTPDAKLTAAPIQRSPGGDFGWLKKVFTGGEPGQHRGHN